MISSLTRVSALFIGMAMNLAVAQDYPSRPITVIVPYSAGGVLDVATRLVADDIATRTGATIVVENRTGADGSIGTHAAIRANADGYTLLAVAPFLVTAPMLRKEAGFKTMDFTPIGLLGVGPNIAVTSPSLPVRTLKEFIDYARARPGKLNAAISARGGSMHLGVEVFMDTTGVQMQTIPFRGAPDSLPSLMRGEISFALLPVSVATPLIKAGKLKPLAVASPVRLAALPEVPTMAEAGAPAENAQAVWYALVARAGTPAAAVKWWNDRINEAVKAPRVSEAYSKMSVIPAGRSVEEFASMLKDEERNWSSRFKKLNIQPE